jgi:hypothetical protein
VRRGDRSLGNTCHTAAVCLCRSAIRPEHCAVRDVQNTQSIIGSPYPDDHRGAGTAEFQTPSGLGKGKPAFVLPPADTKRWSPRRKAAVVVAMRTGVIAREEACERYLLSDEELTGWEAAFDRSGISGLRVTRRRFHRPATP